MTITEAAATVTAAEAVARLAAAETELATVLDRVSESLLSEPSQQTKIAADLAAARFCAELAARAVPAAARLEQSANRQDLLQRADDLESQIVDARKALDDYDAKAARLQKSLENFTGTTWVESAAVHRPAGTVVIGAERAATPRSRRWALRAQLESLIGEQEELRRSAEIVPLPAVSSPEWADASTRLAEAGETLSALSAANVAAVQGSRRLAVIDRLVEELSRQVDPGLPDGGEAQHQIYDLDRERMIVQGRITEAEDQLRLIVGAR